ncbi:MAG: helix-turn-helix domain-containing protein [Desulforhopalus sp.]
MSPDSTKMEYASLGELLRETRINLGLDLAAIAEETRISPKSLQAIEESNFAALPAEAFTRGFYVLYAKSLLLDPEEVLQMYSKERPNQRKSIHSSMLPTSKDAKEVGNMAERPSFLPFSFMGMVLLLLILLGGFLCWYFSWNPATFLSHKLRSLEEPQITEQVSTDHPELATEKQNFLFTRLIKPQSNHHDLFAISYPSTATAAIVREIPESSPPPSIIDDYFINAEFNEKTKVKLKLDDLPERTILFKTGETANWRAKEKAVLIFPAHTLTKLRVNNTLVDLPDMHKGVITLSLPEHLPQ